MSYFINSVLLAVVYSVISMVTKNGQDGKEIIKVRRLPSHREVIHSLVVISGQCCHTKRSVGVFWSFQSVLPYQEVSPGFLVISVSVATPNGQSRFSGHFSQCCHTKRSVRVSWLFQVLVATPRSHLGSLGFFRLVSPRREVSQGLWAISGQCHHTERSVRVCGLFQGSVTAQRGQSGSCLLYTSPSPRDRQRSRMPSSA